MTSQASRSATPTGTLPAPASRPIPFRTLTEQIAHWIRERITQRELGPGMRVREARIARELRTSRAPVREAINQLEREGLVSRRPNQSARVVELTEPMLREAASLRTVLESFGASLAVEHLDTDTLQALAGIVRGMQEAAEAGEFSQVVQQDYAFHDRLMRAAGHQLLYDAWVRIGSQARLLVSGAAHMHRDLRATGRFHAKLLAALRARDKSRTRRLMAEHFNDMSARFIAQVVGKSLEELARPSGGPAKARGPAGPARHAPRS